MQWRFGPGPVFWVEVRAGGRRRRGYVARVAFVAILLLIPVLGMAVVPTVAALTNQNHAMWLFGRAAYSILAIIQVTAVLLAAPAAASDAFGRDRPRGPLSHLLVTDLSALEIVIGTAAARLVPVVMLLMAAVPVAMLGVVVFGIDPESVLTLTMVSLGLAVLGVAVSAALSLSARRSYEALLGVYLLWGACLLLPFVLLRSGPFPAWLTKINPYAVADSWRIFQAGIARRSLSPIEGAAYLGITVLLAALILVLTALSLRAVALREPRPRREPAAGARLGMVVRLWVAVRQCFGWLPGPSLDGNPVLWREWWHARRSRWLGAYWGIYVLGLTVETAIALVEFVSRAVHSSLSDPLCRVLDGVRPAGGGGPFGGGVVGGADGRSGRARRLAVHAALGGGDRAGQVVGVLPAGAGRGDRPLARRDHPGRRRPDVAHGIDRCRSPGHSAAAAAG